MKWKCVNDKCSKYNTEVSVDKDIIGVDGATGNIIHSASTCETCGATNRIEIRKEGHFGKVYSPGNDNVANN